MHCIHRFQFHQQQCTTFKKLLRCNLQASRKTSRNLNTPFLHLLAKINLKKIKENKERNRGETVVLMKIRVVIQYSE